jgi:hypothetical protein
VELKEKDGVAIKQIGEDSKPSAPKSYKKHTKVIENDMYGKTLIEYVCSNLFRIFILESIRE